ncbi:MAG: TetR/AcrR family transcriptional regulator [Leptospiraceae bacterium]|nr:TetR/AcrR family transcriptional regulator [Leptospiraceae bacterium]
MQRARTPEARARKRDLLLQSAREIFVEQGYLNTTVDAITTRAGCSPGTFYIYFDSRATIFKEIMSQGIDILMDLFEEALNWSEEDARSKITGLARAYIDFYQQNNQYFQIMAILSLQSADLRKRDSQISQEIDAKNMRILKQIEAIVQAGQKRGEFKKDLNARTLTISLWGYLDGLLLLETRGNLHTAGMDLNVLVQDSLDTLFNGLMTK